MPNGDIAAQVGWQTYASSQSASLGYDDVNYALDRAAEQYLALRDKVLPAVNQPVFAARRGSAIYNLAGGSWTRITSSPYATPLINTGFGLNNDAAKGWSGGQLTIAKAGIYRVAGHIQFVDALYNRIGIEIVKNTSSSNTANTLARNIVGGYECLSVDCEDLVRLVPGDVLLMLGYQREAGGDSHGIDTGPADISFRVEWVRS